MYPFHRVFNRRTRFLLLRRKRSQNSIGTLRFSREDSRLSAVYCFRHKELVMFSLVSLHKLDLRTQGSTVLEAHRLSENIN